MRQPLSKRQSGLKRMTLGYRPQTELGLDSKDIEVTLTPNVVTLSGSVACGDGRDKAVRVARSYAGDREVEDHLSVQRPD
jgi:osmotically-inducible protein OsmY